MTHTEQTFTEVLDSPCDLDLEDSHQTFRNKYSQRLWTLLVTLTLTIAIKQSKLSEVSLRINPVNNKTTQLWLVHNIQSKIKCKRGSNCTGWNKRPWDHVKKGRKKEKKRKEEACVVNLIYYIHIFILISFFHSLMSLFLPKLLQHNNRHETK